MAKRKMGLAIKGLLDLDERTITEFDKNIGEVTYKLDDLLLPFNGLDSINISISYDSEIEPK